MWISKDHAMMLLNMGTHITFLLCPPLSLSSNLPTTADSVKHLHWRTNLGLNSVPHHNVSLTFHDILTLRFDAQRYVCSWSDSTYINIYFEYQQTMPTLSKR
ncbi:hypothetical protein BCR42DRAFT_25150 [Absidia repens]|uniref:Uncharacterized protein n=1 Tax=Absidia repens TaxID=90262 RepID=A0A1X2IIC8_9FUNG|nr:hypothetical protein BCR42DRAFT_25150 [Absidia repens]